MAKTAVEKRVEADRRHTALVIAMQDAIHTLEAPFSPKDEIPETISDAVAILRDALKGKN